MGSSQGWLSGCVQKKALKQGFWELQKPCCLPNFLKVEQKKSSVDKKDPFVELEVEGICETTPDWGYQDAFRTVSN